MLMNTLTADHGRITKVALHGSIIFPDSVSIAHFTICVLLPGRVRVLRLAVRTGLLLERVSTGEEDRIRLYVARGVK